jgi:two-component system, NarL family, nitrate/nitrite response regulator NarL
VTARVRVVVADPHPVFLDGLERGITEERPDLQLVGAAHDGQDALRQIRELRPEVALVEHDLPVLNGVRVLTAITRESLPTRVLFLSARTDGETVYAAIAAGAAGWLTKDSDRQEIGDAVAAVHRGQTVLSPAVHAGVANEIATRAGEEPPPLTARERQVLALVATGHTVNGVADELRMSRGTVKTHLQHVYEKLGVSSQAAAVAEAIRRGLME